MTSPTDTPPDPDLERLLRERYASLAAAEVVCPELDRVAAAMAGEVSGAARKDALEHAMGCPTCRVAVAPDARVARRPRRRIWIGSAVALAAAAAAIIVLRPSSSPPGDRPPEPSITAKGAGVDPRVTVEVAARRGDREWAIEPGDRLLPGDLVGFIYTASRPVQVAVAYVDAARDPTWLVPSGGGAPVAVSAAVRVALPDAGQMSEGAGCAWFVIVSSERAFALAPLERAIRAAAVRPECGIEIAAPPGVTVSVLAVRR